MEYPICPNCKGSNTYPFEDNFICPDCSYEWNPKADTEAEASNAR